MCILSHASYISDLLNIIINEMNDHRPNAVIIDIREDMGKVRFFANVRDIWHASIF